MSTDKLQDTVKTELDSCGMTYSDEDLTIIMGNVENWLTLTDCTIKEAVKHVVNYEDPWNEY